MRLAGGAARAHHTRGRCCALSVPFGQNRVGNAVANVTADFLVSPYLLSSRRVTGRFRRTQTGASKDDGDILGSWLRMGEFARGRGYEITKFTLSKPASSAINTGPELVGYFGQLPASTKERMRALVAFFSAIAISLSATKDGRRCCAAAFVIFMPSLRASDSIRYRSLRPAHSPGVRAPRSAGAHSPRTAREFPARGRGESGARNGGMGGISRWKRCPKASCDVR
jgi:hypothetical protein